MRLPLLLLCSAALVAVAGCHDARSDRVRVERAWVRLPAAPGLPAAAYLTVLGGPTPERLVSVGSVRTRASEIHESMTTAAPGGGGMATMRQVDGIDVPAHGEAKLEPGGFHVMLFGLAPGLRPGDAVPLTAWFAQGAPIEVEAKAVGAGDAAPY